jgi:hypothetical protein
VRWLLVACAAAPLAAPAASAAPFVIRGDYRVGEFRVKADGTLGGARAAFGEPSSRVLRGGVCHVDWRSAGVRMTFYNLGGESPCDSRTGRFGTAVITGPRWRTSKGLRIGAPSASVGRFFPRARYRIDAYYGAGWWLVVRTTPFGLGDEYPGLLARVRGSRVTAFVIRYQAGGE